MKRKLTTIFYADVQRFSSMMASDEAETLSRLKRYRAIMSRLFDRYEGRQVNTWGDAVIAEFESVVEAVRCSVEIQDALSAENRDLPEGRQMWLRIGINLGDVMNDNGDLYGDGVNVAQRLETMAEPGGILVSETVYSLARKQLALGFDYNGEQSVKGIDEPVTVYSVRMTGRNRPNDDTIPEEGGTSAAEPDPQSTLSSFAIQAETGLAWLKRQPRRIRIAAGLIGFFFALNILFSGIANPWFVFPSAPLALYIYFHYRRVKIRR